VRLPGAGGMTARGRNYLPPLPLQQAPVAPESPLLLLLGPRLTGPTTTRALRKGDLLETRKDKTRLQSQRLHDQTTYQRRRVQLEAPSDEAKECKPVYAATTTMPCVDSGAIPYTLRSRMLHRTASVDGSTATRPSAAPKQ